MTIMDTSNNCSNCGSGCSLDAQYCGTCGSPLKSNNSETDSIFVNTGKAASTQKKPANPTISNEPTTPSPTLSFPQTLKPSPPPPTPPSSFWTPGKFISLLFTIIFLGAALFLVAYQIGKNSSQPSTNLSTSSSTSPSTSTSTTVGNTPTVTAQPASGTITFNQELTCSDCGDYPVLVFINQATINTTAQDMTLNIKVSNRSGSGVNFLFTTFSLQRPSGSLYQGSGDFVNLYQSLDGQQSESNAVIFDLVPNKGESYSLTVKITYNLNAYNDTSYDPAVLKF